MDLALKTLDHDLDFSTGDLDLLEGAEAVAQNLRIRLQFFLGEWFLDFRQGMPYFEKILVKNPGTNVVRSIIRKTVTSTPGVLALIALNTTYEGTIRKLTVAFTCRITGTDAPLEFTEEFIIL